MAIPIMSPSTELPGGGGRQRGLVGRGLRAGYVPGRAVLDGVEAAAVTGRLTALLGPNGCGKSTLLKVLLGQLTPWSGNVTLDGQPVGSIGRLDLARRVSYVPQRGESGFAFTVRQMVAMGRFAFGDEAFVDAALDRCGLSELAGRSVHTLSGGQLQRVWVARAWAQSRGGGGVRGEAVLADEPASSLDLRQADTVMRLLRDLAREGLAVVVVLHGLDLALRWADDVWLMHEGRMVAQGLPGDVLTPAVLEPVYGVRLGQTQDASGQRLVYVRSS